MDKRDKERQLDRITIALEEIASELKEKNARKADKEARRLTLGASHTAIRRGFEGTGQGRR